MLTSYKKQGARNVDLADSWKFVLVYCALYVWIFHSTRLSRHPNAWVIYWAGFWKKISWATFLSLAICALCNVQGSSSHAQSIGPLSFLLWSHLVILRLWSSKSLLLSLQWTWISISVLVELSSFWLADTVYIIISSINIMIRNTSMGHVEFFWMKMVTNLKSLTSGKEHSQSYPGPVFGSASTF